MGPWVRHAFAPHVSRITYTCTKYILYRYAPPHSTLQCVGVDQEGNDEEDADAEEDEEDEVDEEDEEEDEDEEEEDEDEDEEEEDEEDDAESDEPPTRRRLGLRRGTSSSVGSFIAGRSRTRCTLRTAASRCPVDAVETKGNSRIRLRVSTLLLPSFSESPVLDVSFGSSNRHVGQVLWRSSQGTTQARWNRWLQGKDTASSPHLKFS